MPREAAAPAPLERMPVELRVSIMGHITNFKSLRNLVVSSRVYKETLRSNEPSIAMAIIVNLVGQDNYKLAIMAEVSSHITVADKTAVEGFIDNYTRPEEWPLSVYSMRLAIAVRRLNKTMYKAMSTIRCDDLNIWHLGSQSLSWTERTRLHRVLYLCEIAGNLFRWNNHTIPAMHIPPPFPDLCRRFWKQVPAWDAARLQIMVSSPNFHENVTAASKSSPIHISAHVSLSYILVRRQRKLSVAQCNPISPPPRRTCVASYSDSARAVAR